MAICIFGPVRNFIPIGGFAGLRDALADGDRPTRMTDVTNIGRSIRFFTIKFRNFLGRTHVGILMLDAILLIQSYS